MRIRKLRFALVYPLAIGLFALAHPTDQSLFFGGMIIALGEALRVWANGCVGHLKVNRAKTTGPGSTSGRLITGGPYAYMRNPLYLGTFVIGLGLCLAVKSLWLVLASLVFFISVYPRKVVEEEEVLRSEWGEPFAAYARRVHAWIPRWRPYAKAHGRWSWQGIEASQEVKTIIWLLVAFGAIYFHKEWVLEREPLAWKHALVLGGALGLVGFDLGSTWARWSARRAHS